MTETDREQARRLYGLIVNHCFPDEQIQERVQIIRRLEELTEHSFKDTADFVSKMDDYLLSDETAGAKLKAFRTSKRWSLSTMGAHLGVTRQLVAQMEGGRKPLTEKALSLVC